MFSQATMLTEPTLRRDRNELVITWESSSPPGTWFQLYLNNVLAWWGTERIRRVPLPRGDATLFVTVGTVDPGEGGIDFSSSLPVIPKDRVQLEWEGGYWQGEDLVGFRVYGSPPDGPVNMSTPLATVNAGDESEVSGFGQGGFGMGGFGVGSSIYRWKSGKLETGLYTFAVAPFDLAGNEQLSPLTVTAFVAVPPLPPAPGPGGVRLKYELDPDTLVPTLIWLASPSND